MACKEIIIDETKVEVEANGATILIYEDAFKGRRFLQDINEIQKIEEPTDYPLTTFCRVLWATAKTANDSIPDMFKWSAQFTCSGLLKSAGEALALISENLKPTVKN